VPDVAATSKNTRVGGPLGAHVYNNPGTYRAAVTVTNPATGAASQAFVDITVADPNAAYPGTNTIVVSPTSNWTGAPAGAERRTTYPADFSGKRVLLQRGASFDQIIIDHHDSLVQVGAYGTGAKPGVAGVNISVGYPPGGDVWGRWPDDITLVDLDLSAPIQHNGTGRRLLFHRCDLDNVNAENHIEVAGALDYLVSEEGAPFFTNPREIFISECIAKGSGTILPVGNCCDVIGAYLAILGCDMGYADFHTIRVHRVYKGLLAHNALRGRSSDGIRVCLKLHSRGYTPYADQVTQSGSDWASRYVVIANNQLGDQHDNNQYLGGAGPQNTVSGEGVEDVLLENNTFLRGPRHVLDFMFAGRRMTSRGNSVVGGGAVKISASDMAPNAALSAEWKGPIDIQEYA
jgi:hypothetical protein